LVVLLLLQVTQNSREVLLEAEEATMEDAWTDESLNDMPKTLTLRWNLLA
jgi:hypothetical protein